MPLTVFDDAVAFRDRVRPLLLKDEARHGLPLGVLDRLCAGLAFSDAPPFMALETRDDGTAPIALMTPPFPLQLHCADVAFADLVIDHLLATRLDDIGGVMADPDLVAHVTARVVAATGRAHRTQYRQALHRLDAVRVVPANVPGQPRRARPDDERRLCDWLHAFHLECGMIEAKAGPPATLSAAHDGSAWVWDDDGVVAMTLYLRDTPRGVALGYVYTPPAARGRGYASALVAAMSQAALDDGKDFLVLFTDLSNPVSNRIYQRVGFDRFAEFQVELFAADEREH